MATRVLIGLLALCFAIVTSGCGGGSRLADDPVPPITVTFKYGPPDDGVRGDRQGRVGVRGAVVRRRGPPRADARRSIAGESRAYRCFPIVSIHARRIRRGAHSTGEVRLHPAGRLEGRVLHAMPECRSSEPRR